MAKRRRLTRRLTLEEQKACALEQMHTALAAIEKRTASSVERWALTRLLGTGLLLFYLVEALEPEAVPAELDRLMDVLRDALPGRIPGKQRRVH